MSYRDLSFWLDSVPDDLAPRPALDGDVDADVAIVGGGYTGLWTAYYLAVAAPELRIVVLEREICGFGASGRNGGWCSALFAASKAKIAARYGRDAAIALQRAMIETVDEVGRVCAAENIDAHYVKSGTLTFATAPVHVARLRQGVREERSWGLGPDDVSWLDAGDAAARIGIARCYGAAFTPHCATIHPARLVRGLARAVEGRGVAIHEGTSATSIEPGRVTTARGAVRARTIVRATEGYTPRLPGHRRRLMPIYSLMVATEPLPGSFWREVGWERRETMTDGRHLIVYAQRTADDRIAIGGRGAPYHFASRVHDAYDRDNRVFAELERVLHDLWPPSSDAAITHRWGGPLGVPRDWFSSVTFDSSTGLAAAGGYVGDGVSTSNLAGRTLADLVLGRDTELTRLPWVGHRSRNWEPEPLRWAGVNLALRTMASADRVEARSGVEARRARIVSRLTGT